MVMICPGHAGLDGQRAGGRSACSSSPSVVLFSAVVSSVIASATTPLLLAFILPVAIARAGVADPRARRRLGARGGGLADRDHDPVAVAGRLPGRGARDRRLPRAGRADPRRDRVGDGRLRDELELAYDEARAQADAAVGALDKLFLATPYRPTGLSTKARAEIRLVDELRWLSEAVLRSGLRTSAVRRTIDLRGQARRRRRARACRVGARGRRHRRRRPRRARTRGRARPPARGAA